MTTFEADAGGYEVDFETTGILDGFEVIVRKRLDARRIPRLTRYLLKLGLRPRPLPVAFATSPEGHPICPKHGVPMKPREKQGDTWHSHKLINGAGEEVYCRGYPGPDSPGWKVDMGEARG